MTCNFPQRPRYSVPELLDALGFSRSTFYARVKAGLIKLTKDGRRSFVSAEELERYLKACEVAQ